MKKVLAVTGIRSDYDIMYPVLKEMQKSGNFDVRLVVTGAHLSEFHGFTLERIIQDGFTIADKIDYLLSTNRVTQRSKGVGLLIAGLTQTVERENPDFIMFLGDREESISCSVVGNYMDKLVVHLGAGDPVWGNADDPIRAACSKLAHIHVAFAKPYAENLRKNGEDDFRILFSGNPSYANIYSEPLLSRQEIAEFLNFDVVNNDYVVLLKHPLSSELEFAAEQMKIACQALNEFSKTNSIKVVGIYPNTDPGAYDILDVIKNAENENMHFFKTLPRNIFINLIRNAKCLAGNSSMGILEAPFYKLPVVNIGNRQQGRLNAGNVEFVAHNVDEIVKALTKACFDKNYRNYVQNLVNPYGDQTAPQKIVSFLEKVDTNDRKWYVKSHLFG